VPHFVHEPVKQNRSSDVIIDNWAAPRGRTCRIDDAIIRILTAESLVGNKILALGFELESGKNKEARAGGPSRRWMATYQ
jgi:hypothetical protein